MSLDTTASVLIRVVLAAAGILTVSVLLFGILGLEGTENLYLFQAESFLDGRVDLEYAQNDTITRDRDVLIPFPPGPSAVLLPFVVLFGTAEFLPPTIALLLSILSYMVLRSILVHLGVGDKLRRWVLAAFFLGTGYWSCLLMSTGAGECYFAHIMSVMFTLLAIREALISGRGLMAGLFLGTALLCRQLSIFTAIFIFPILWAGYGETEGKRSESIKFASVLLLFIGFMGLWNYSRFGDILESGYSLVTLDGFLAKRVARLGTFNIQYIPYNLYEMFLKGFSFVPSRSTHMLTGTPDPFGTSLTFASPFIFFAVYASRYMKTGKKLVTGAWLSIVVSMVPMLLYYNNGWIQINCQRFTLDFMPVLILLTALGSRRNPLAFKILVGYSVALNVFALSSLFVPQILGF